MSMLHYYSPHLLMVMAILIGVFASSCLATGNDDALPHIEQRIKAIENNLPTEILSFSQILPLLKQIESTTLVSRESVSILKLAIITHDVYNAPDTATLLRSCLKTNIKTILAEISAGSSEISIGGHILDSTSAFEAGMILLGNLPVINLSKSISLSDIVPEHLTKRHYETLYWEARLIQVKQDVMAEIENDYSKFLSDQASINHLLVKLENASSRFERLSLGIKSELTDGDFTLEHLEIAREQISEIRSQLISTITQMQYLKSEMTRLAGE